MRRYFLLALSLTACTRADKEPRYDGPMPVVFGECAGPKVSFVSGPRPLPFTPDEADGAAAAPDVVAKNDPPPEAKDDPPAPEPEPDHDSGGSGEHAHTAGVLGGDALTQGGAFASLTGTGDISSGFDDTNIYGGLLGNEAGEMQGGFGFGRAGFGPGGGGTGWGTIGTGRYGTIGHGSGTGSGYGVGGGRGGMRGRTAAVPTVSIGQPNAQGDLDKAIIRRYIKRNIQKITYCYEKELLVKPQLSGTVQTQFFITPDGNVASATGKGVDQNVADCVANVIKGIEFPKPKGGGGVQVNYPFTFRPAGAGGDSTPPTAPPISAAGAGSDSAGSGAPEAPATPPPPPPAAPIADPARHLYRTSVQPVPDLSKYDPGANNPLRAQEKDLSECFRRGPNHYGAAVVELTYDAAGKVTNVVPHGVQHESARKCVAKIAKRITRPAGAGAATTQRCSVSFGVMPVSALPGVDITSGIAFNGKPLISADVLERDDSMFKLDQVVDATEARVKAASSTKAPIVSIHGPLAVRPAPTTPMKHVDRVLRSILAGGDDYVLASSSGTEWTLLTPMTLPLVPVPIGTGGRWNRMKTLNRDVSSISDDERVVLSILIANDRIWVGLSRVNEFTEHPAGADQLSKLAKTLKANKSSAFFADRTDVEIGAEGDVPYETFVKVVQAAVAAGFTEWRQTDPNGLSARPTL
jgi:hypothetical protein